MKILHLTLKKKWFKMILSGEKKEEYREIKPYWTRRFKNYWNLNHFDIVEFTNGYKKDSPKFQIECKDIVEGFAKPEWSDNFKDKCYIIKLGNIL